MLPDGSGLEFLRRLRDGSQIPVIVLTSRAARGAPRHGALRGPGVDPAIAARAFERFTTTRQGAGGTGLGLAIVRAVAEAHGGRAELRTPADAAEGTTTFALVLPSA